MNLFLHFIFFILGKRFGLLYMNYYHHEEEDGRSKNEKEKQFKMKYNFLLNNQIIDLKHFRKLKNKSYPSSNKKTIFFKIDSNIGLLFLSDNLKFDILF